MGNAEHFEGERTTGEAAFGIRDDSVRVRGGPLRVRPAAIPGGKRNPLRRDRSLPDSEKTRGPGQDGQKGRREDRAHAPDGGTHGDPRSHAGSGSASGSSARPGRRFEGKTWTRNHWRWIRAQKVEDPNSETVLSEYIAAIDQEVERIGRLDAQIEQESKNPEIAPAIARLKALRGVKTLTAMTILSELIDLNRFESARKLMGFVGLVPGEYSSGGKQWRGSITKSGNSHVRRVLVEAAWHYRHSPRKTGEAIRKRREGQPPEVIETARKAELRLYKKFTRLVMRGKKTTVAATAVARELAGFVWAIGRI
jgi:hypothetical protein